MNLTYESTKYISFIRHISSSRRLAEQELQADDVFFIAKKPQSFLIQTLRRSVPSASVIATIVLPPDFVREIRHYYLLSCRENDPLCRRATEERKER